MKWLRRLFCAHAWRTKFTITRNGTVISTHCARCGKTGKPDHFWPRFGDQITVEPGLELIDELKELES